MDRLYRRGIIAGYQDKRLGGVWTPGNSRKARGDEERQQNENPNLAGEDVVLAKLLEPYA